MGDWFDTEVKPETRVSLAVYLPLRRAQRQINGFSLPQRLRRCGVALSLLIPKSGSRIFKQCLGGIADIGGIIRTSHERFAYASGVRSEKLRAPDLAQ